MAGMTVTHDEAALVAALAERDIRHMPRAFQRKFAHFKVQLSND
jgi:hypothetical protein